MTAKHILLRDDASSALSPDPAKSSQRILVVEDDRFLRQINTEALVDSGYEVNAVADGACAWDALQLKNYDLLVTDNCMPKVTGIELVEKIRSARMALPVIMATGAVPRDERDRNLWVQINVILLKPYTLDALLGAVKEVLFMGDYAVKKAGPPTSWQSMSKMPGPGT